jgi:hypothetical protein
VECRVLEVDYNTSDILAMHNGGFTAKRVSKKDLPTSTLDGLRAAGFCYEAWNRR